MKRTKKTGFTIIEVLVATGIMTVVALGLATMVQYTTKSSKNVQSNLEFQNLSALLRNFFLKSVNCSNIFNVIPLLTFNPASATATIPLNEIRAQTTGNILARLNTDITSGLRLTVLDVRNFHVTSNPDIFLADVHLEASKSEGSFVGSRTVSANIGIQLNTQLAGTNRAVLSCELFSGPTTQQTCIALGGTFNAGANPPCQFPSNITTYDCPTGQVARGITNGMLNCVSLNSLVNCPSGQVLQGFDINGTAKCVTVKVIGQGAQNWLCYCGSIANGRVFETDQSWNVCGSHSGTSSCGFDYCTIDFTDWWTCTLLP